MNTQDNEIPQTCPRCLKPQAYCVCSSVSPQTTRLQILILQHPQERQEVLATAKLAELVLPHAQVRVGLSWPNLKAALRKPSDSILTPSRWAVLYLGSGLRTPKAAGATRPKPGLVFLDRKGVRLERPPVNAKGKPMEIDGIVLLDGSWSQAKSLWWRNAWLLKLRRCALVPDGPSLYGKTRKEPRRECLSTLEALAQALVALGEPPTVRTALEAPFIQLLDAVRRGERTQK